MFIRIAVLFALFSGGFCQTQSNVNWVGHREYFTELLQATFNKVEEGSWCNLKIPDFSQDIDLDLYGFVVQGTVTYRDGFMVSLQSIDIPMIGGITQFWNHINNVTTGTMSSSVDMHEVALGFDVQLDLVDGTTRNYTGIYTYERIRYSLSLMKGMQTDQLRSSSLLDTMSGGTRRMEYLPADQHSQVLSRQLAQATRLAVSAIWNAAIGWGDRILAPAMLELASTQMPVPDVCYNCPLT